MEIFQSYAMGSKSLLVNLHFSQHTHLNADLTELKGLINAVDWQVLGVISGQRVHPDVKYFCGQGKIDEIIQLVAAEGADLVVFNHTLSATQERNIEKAVGCKVVDRTRLILEIFAKRAHSYEGKLQVELAQLNYAATRLVRGWTHLERQRGGIGVRGGPGEKQIELDRRLLRERIDKIEAKLEKVKKQRHIGRHSRQKHAIPSIAFIGYTNAGKSTLFNYLTGANVYVQDQLFATLDPTLRHVNIPQLGKAIVSDTVGFVRNLPHTLVEAFHATLEEAIQADLLIHVVDYADPEYLAYIEQVQMVLEQIDAADKPVLVVYNKIDLLEDVTSGYTTSYDDTRTVYLSAEKQQGIESLYQAIADHFAQQWHKGILRLAPEHGRLRAALYSLGAVEGETPQQDGMIDLQVCLSEKDYERLQRQHHIDFSHMWLNE